MGKDGFDLPGMDAMGLMMMVPTVRRQAIAAIALHAAMQQEIEFEEDGKSVIGIPPPSIAAEIAIDYADALIQALEDKG
jgi:hypothetical protein